MKKGFTLIELLGVIAILGILSAVAIPTINYSINKNKEKLYKTQTDQIIKGAEDYFATHLDELPKEGKSTTKTIRELQNAGNLETNIKNPKTGELFNQDTTYVLIKKEKNNYKYCISYNQTECEVN